MDMSLRAIRVQVDEERLRELDQLAGERRQSRATLGGLLLERALAAAVQAESQAVDAAKLLSAGAA